MDCSKKITVLVDCRTDGECIGSLESYGCQVVRLPAYPALAEPVSAHPDMLVYKLKDSLLVSEGYWRTAGVKRLLDGVGVRLTLTCEEMGGAYPHDVLLNALKLGGTVYGRTDVISKYIIEDSVGAVYMRQGYARCAVCVINDGAVITSDCGIAAALGSRGIDVLRISAGSVCLDGYGYGFIGGACGRISGDAVLFFGDVKRHPDYMLMKRFAGKYGVGLYSLSDGPLYDRGGMIFIENMPNIIIKNIEKYE